jgi:CDP-glucose 4,6-dehydratase
MEAMVKKDFWKDKQVLVTGHTGFKGAWLSLWLHELGAQVIGYALKPPTKPNLFEICGLEKKNNLTFERY